MTQTATRATLTGHGQRDQYRTGRFGSISNRCVALVCLELVATDLVLTTSNDQGQR